MAEIVRPHARRRALIILGLLLAACVAGAAIAHFGGRWAIPTWGLFIIAALMMTGPLVALVSLAAWLFAKAHRAETRAKESLDWPTARGKVLSSELQAFYVGNGDVYSPVVRYEYTAGERRHEGDKIVFGMTHLRSKKKAESYLEGRGEGAAVTVHYDPENPAVAVLDTASVEAQSLRRSAWKFLGVAAFVYGLMGIGFFH